MMGIGSVLLGAAAAVAAIVCASAAELPTMRPARVEHERPCHVGGMSGVQIPGSDACLKLGGYISGGVEVGNVKPAYNWAAPSH
jgi:Porin subfamily